MVSNFVSDVVASLLDGTINDGVVNDALKPGWIQTVEAANEAYKPGTFTTFAGYEFTSSTDEREALHRNVIFRGAERLPAQPFSRFNSMNPEGLWDWMDALRKQDIESLAIPHNSNGSNGAMFMFTDWAGNAIDQEYADQRMRNEPLVEITQVKGTSDTHPLLSRNDEWANFEIFPLRTSTRISSNPRGSYVRNAWLRGLSMAESAAANPYKFGAIGSSDTHTGAASLQEDNYFGKIGTFDDTAEKRGSIPASFLYGTLVKLDAPEMVEVVDDQTYLDFSGYKYWGASGIAGVWAEENTRDQGADQISNPAQHDDGERLHGQRKADRGINRKQHRIEHGGDGDDAGSEREGQRVHPVGFDTADRGAGMILGHCPHGAPEPALLDV